MPNFPKQVGHLVPVLPSMPHATSDVQQRSAAPLPPSQCPSETFCLMQRWTDIRLSSSSLNFTYHKTPTRDLEKTTAYLASPVTTPPGAWLLLNSQIQLHAVSLRVMGSAPAKSPSPPSPAPSSHHLWSFNWELWAPQSWRLSLVEPTSTGQGTPGEGLLCPSSAGGQQTSGFFI